jgi:hypothetical protein
LLRKTYTDLLSIVRRTLPQLLVLRRCHLQTNYSGLESEARRLGQVGKHCPQPKGRSPIRPRPILPSHNPRHRLPRQARRERPISKDGGQWTFPGPAPAQSLTTAVLKLGPKLPRRVSSRPSRQDPKNLSPRSMLSLSTGYVSGSAPRIHTTIMHLRIARASRYPSRTCSEGTGIRPRLYPSTMTLGRPPS